MDQTQHYYVGSVGLDILVDTGLDLADASSVRFDVKKPNGTLATWTATLYTAGGSVSEARYTTVAGDFDQPGTYSLHALVTRADGFAVPGNEALFLVENLHPKRR